MEEALWMATMFFAGAGVGALYSYDRDRKLISLYSHLVADLSRMIRRPGPDLPAPPAMAARVAEIPPLVEAQRKAAS